MPNPKIKLGIVSMSAKPYHVGHDELIKMAARECDYVYLFVSLSDRGLIKGKSMEKIWHDWIVPNLPENVIVEFGGSPIRKAWELLIDENEDPRKNTIYYIYSDESDVGSNFPDERLQKYAPNLFLAGRILKKPVSRQSTVSVSGTEMREFLSKNDKKSFFRFLPNYMNKNVIWNLLKEPNKSSKV